MTTIREKTFSVGKYLVSPLITRHDDRHFSAGVSIRSGCGSNTHDRVFRFAPQFSTRQGAAHYAAAQGLQWLQQRA